METVENGQQNKNSQNPQYQNTNEPDTLVERLEAAKNEGYTYDFNLTAHALEAHQDDGVKLSLSPEDFDIVDFYRFEGMTNPSDMSILYLIESNEGIKGTLVSGYGISADEMSNEMIKKLDTRSKYVKGAGDAPASAS
ncbi:hypothetical protein CLV98_11773 [Dyadobacter jejuensis]|uniref:Phosphoribosylpyrophosphate synthetase n=1 Tax=Dyadobacter jejuensis TaxID=1082580 RepID=A0A316A9U3_9BACT|nr:hypothetical protein [Dyadobacter jejuensis]PWJ54535.1 hypothetical protein CLV98_11773 [Dyadobacter jejuensis]